MTDTIISIIQAAYRDYAQQEMVQQLQDAYLKYREVEVDCRRKESSAIILQMGVLKFSLFKLQQTYNRIKQQGTIPALEQFIRQQELEIKKLSVLKNR